MQGSPGIGKTTCVMALAREMLGDSAKDGVLELNASDERGIDVVRGKIKMFAQHKVSVICNSVPLAFVDCSASLNPSLPGDHAAISFLSVWFDTGDSAAGKAQDCDS